MSAITITFGDCAENNIGMQRLGTIADSGFTYQELVDAKLRFESKDPNVECEIVDLTASQPAHVLIVRNGINILLENNDDEGQEPNYEAGQGRIVAFRDVPYTAIAREAISNFFGPRARELLAEGNYYYDPNKCGIGFHGDGERRKVIALRLGTSIPLHFQWFYRGLPQGSRIIINLNHGDLYAMSDKAVGHDWRKTTIYTLRHAAGAEKYLLIK
ncbi:uncharacterized protein LOC136088442 [Hydra vulgaris]|uniref:Uncharacterized protein LOC136088442 n=1 Tax=Hydra vulgaris TaxID=6087 RepID=A0ABM4D1T7_HYDVU